MIILFSWIATFLSFLGIILNAKKIIWCWLFYILGSIFWILIAVFEINYPQIVLWTIFLGSNIYGWRQWYLDEKVKN